MNLYTTLSLTMSIPVVIAAGIALWRLPAAVRRRWLIASSLALVILLVLTAVFDNLMIAAGLVAYDDSRTSGIKIGVAPIEDFSYTLAVALLLPAAWFLLRRPADRATDATPVSARTPSRRSLVVELFWTSRPVSWVNTAAPFVLAYFLATGTVDVRGIVGTVFFLVPYNLAMYGINDVFDYESDLRNPRKGGVEGSVLDRSVHTATLIAAVVMTVPFVGYLIVTGTLASSVILLLVMFAVVAYSARGLRFKEIPFLDSITSSAHFVGPGIFAWALTGQDFDGPVLVCLVAFFLWGAGSHSFGAVQDIRADRAGGLASIATVLGARATVLFSTSCYAIAFLALVILAPWPASAAAFATLPYIANVASYLAVSDSECEQTHEGWERFLILNMLSGFLVTQLILWSVLVWN